ncbi:MAG: hypothetical protein ACP6IS_04195 [Candidatus Asgardarchaeia archaeon]
MTEIIVPIIEFGKVIIQFMLAGLLLQKWISAEKRFFTDIPFQFGILFFFIAVGEFMDTFFDASIIPETLLLYKIRLSFVIFGLAAMVFLLSVIWFRRNYKMHSILLFSFIGVFLLLLTIAVSHEVALIIVSISVVITTVPGIITLLIVWRLKRLPDFNSLLAAIAIFIILVGQILEAIIGEFGYLAFTESVDLVGWILLYASTVIKPNYS